MSSTEDKSVKSTTSAPATEGKAFDWTSLKRTVDERERRKAAVDDLRSELRLDYRQGEAVPGETQVEKLKRKLRENPFVPIGCGLTAFCLTYGLIQFQRKKMQQSQTMMRARVLAQGFTVIACVGGALYNMGKKA